MATRELPWYDICASADTGDTAEAQGIEAARVAALTLVEDGATTAAIYPAGEYGRPAVEHAARCARTGQPMIHSSDLARSLR